MSDLVKQEFENARAVRSDIHEHIDLLYNLACKCDSVVEGGVRYVVSTWAFIYGCACRGGTVTSYCWNMLPEIQRALDICAKEDVSWTFHKGDWLNQEIPETDLLFIDTNHEYKQLTRELVQHSPKTQKYIALHDTTRFGEVGSDGKRPGMWQAIEEFLADGKWGLQAKYENCNGLTILERERDED